MNELQQDQIKYREQVARANSLKYLFKDPNFKKIIVEGYLKEHLRELVLNHEDPKLIESVAFFNDYLNNIQEQGVIALNSLEEIDKEIANER